MNIGTYCADLDAAHAKLVNAKRQLASSWTYIENSRFDQYLHGFPDNTAEYIEQKIAYGDAECEIREAEADIWMASGCYHGLATAAWMNELEAMPWRKVTVAELWRLYRAAVAAEKAFRTLPDDASPRERTAAQITAERAHGFYDLATRFFDGRGQYPSRERLIDAVGGWLKPPSRPEPTGPKKALVHGRHIKTGKFVRIDGVRVPLLKKVK